MWIFIVFASPVLYADSICSGWRQGFERYRSFCEKISPEIAEIASGNYTLEQIKRKLEIVVIKIDNSVAFINAAGQTSIWLSLLVTTLIASTLPVSL